MPHDVKSLIDLLTGEYNYFKEEFIADALISPNKASARADLAIFIAGAARVIIEIEDRLQPDEMLDARIRRYWRLKPRDSEFYVYFSARDEPKTFLVSKASKGSCKLEAADFSKHGDLIDKLAAEILSFFYRSFGNVYTGETRLEILNSILILKKFVPRFNFELFASGEDTPGKMDRVISEARSVVPYLELTNPISKGVKEDEICQMLRYFDNFNMDENSFPAKYEAFYARIFDLFIQTDPATATLMVHLCAPTLDSSFLDLGCGSGNIILAMVKYFITKNPDSGRKTLDTLSHLISGLDNNSFALTICKFRMMLAGITPLHVDLENIFSTTREHQKDHFGFIFSEPPFGNKVNDVEQLRFFDLAQTGTKVRPITSEILFLERAYYMLKQGGRLGIILPTSVLNQEKGRRAREFIMNRFIIKAIIELPITQHLFSNYQGTSVKTSLLILDKPRPGQIMPDYPIFMAIMNEFPAGDELDKFITRIIEDFQKTMEDHDE